MSDKTIRCTACGGEFTDDDVVGHSACPSCDHRGIPMAIAMDVTIKINIHELRILTIWAGAWAAGHRAEDPNMGAALDGILSRLRRQLPGVGLTLADDIQEVASATGSRVTLVAGVTEVFNPKVKQ